MSKLSFLKINFIDKVTFYFKLFCFIFLTLKLVFLKVLVQMFSKKLAIKVVQYYHKLVLWLINIDIEVTGVQHSHKVATLYEGAYLKYEKPTKIIKEYFDTEKLKMELKTDDPKYTKMYNIISSR